MTRVFVVSHARLYADGLARLLSSDGRLSVVGSAEGLPAALSRMGRLRRPPESVLVDLDLPHGGDAMRALLAAMPTASPIALVDSEHDNAVISWAEAGAAGLVVRNASVDDLVHALQRAAHGEPAWSPSAAATLLRSFSRRGRNGSSNGAPLTSRECEVIALIDRGCTNKEIATELDIELPTVKNHVHHILAKLHASRRGEAAAIIRSAGSSVASVR